MRAFPTPDVLSIVTGKAITDRGWVGIHEVLEYMAGEDIPMEAEALTEVRQLALPLLLQADARLRQVLQEGQRVGPADVDKWRTRWLLRFGESIRVPRLAPGSYSQSANKSKLGGPMAGRKIWIPPEKMN